MALSKTRQEERKSVGADARKTMLSTMVEDIKLKQGITQEGIAEQLNYRKNAISDMLSPKGEVSVKFLKRLEKEFFGKTEPAEVLGSATKNEGIDQNMLLISQAMEKVSDIFKQLSVNLMTATLNKPGKPSRNRKTGSSGNANKQAGQGSPLSPSTGRINRQAEGVMSEKIKRSKEDQDGQIFS